MSHNNPSKEKGTAAEVAVVQFLRTAGGYAHAERRALAGSKDRGDIAGIPAVVIEVKNEQKMNLAGWVDEAIRERWEGNHGPAVVWHKRRGKGSPGEWYVTMDGWSFLELLSEWTRI